MYLGPCQVPITERFVKIVNSSKLPTIFSKHSKSFLEIFDSVLNTPLNSMNFVLTWRINCFLIFMFYTDGVNVSMTMLLTSLSIFNDSEAVSNKHFT